MAFLFFLGSRSRIAQAALLDWEGSVGSPGSERHHAQDLAFKCRVDPASDGICDGLRYIRVRASTIARATHTRRLGLRSAGVDKAGVMG